MSPKRPTAVGCSSSPRRNHTTGNTSSVQPAAARHLLDITERAQGLARVVAQLERHADELRARGLHPGVADAAQAVGFGAERVLALAGIAVEREQLLVHAAVRRVRDQLPRRRADADLQ